MRFIAEERVEIWANMHNNQKTEAQMKNFLVHQRIDDQVVICGKVAERGDNVLEITAKDKGKSVHISSYLLTSDHAAFDPLPYPEKVKRIIGATIANHNLMVEPKSHPSALIQAPDTGEVEIVMKTPVPCELRGELEFNSASGTSRMDGYTSVTQIAKEAKFKVRIPQSGVYCLQIFGKKSGTEDDYSNIYNYIIEAPLPKERCFIFPETCSNWKTEYWIIQPTNRILPSDHKLPVAVKIPAAEQVAVIGSSGRTSLFKRDNDVWRGDVRTGSPGEDFLLAAVFPGDDKGFRHLLKYQVRVIS